MKLAHEERVIAKGHEIVFKPFHHGFGAFLNVDDGILIVD